MNGSYKDLRVWNEAMDLAETVYALSKTFPRNEDYGLADQLRRAAVSVPSNIAEGKGRHSGPEFCRFLFHARGSLLEMETQIELARRVKYISDQSASDLLERTATVARRLNALINAIAGEKNRTNS